MALAIGLCTLPWLQVQGESRSETAGAVTNTVQAPKKTGKVLVAYFTAPEPDGVDASSGASRVTVSGKSYGNTEYVARVIADATGSDLFVIRTVQTYPGDYKALVEVAKKEAEAGARPRLTARIKNLKDYDVVFVGYPNWWYDMPMPLYTFFENHDFRGKTVVPFCTHGGSRFSQSVKTIASLEKEAAVIQGPAVAHDKVGSACEEVRKWLQKQGFVK